MKEDILTGRGIFSCLLARDDGELIQGWEYRGSIRFEASSLEDLRDMGALLIECDNEFNAFVEMSDNTETNALSVRFADLAILFVKE